MIGFKIILTGGDLYAATEKITVSGITFDSWLQTATKLSIKASSVLGGLVKPQLGTVTFFDTSGLADLLSLNVIAYKINVVQDTATEIGPYVLTQSKRTLDLLTYTVWDGEDDVLFTEDKYFNYYMDNNTNTTAFAYTRGLLGITTITTVEDNSFSCPSYSGFKESSTEAFIPEGSSAIKVLDSLLKSRCCVGIRNGNSIEVINLFSGYKNVHRIKSTVFNTTITYNQYKNLKISTKSACYADVNYKDKSFDSSTTHVISPYGADISIDAYSPYTKTRSHTVNAYKVFLNFPLATVKLTADISVNVGDLVVVDDIKLSTLGTPIPFTFIVTGMEYTKSLDEYTVFGVGARFYEMPDGSGGTFWAFDNCPLWDGVGTTPTSTLRAPTAGQSFDNITNVTITWDHVDAVILDILVMIQQTAPSYGVPQYINVCSKRVTSDGTVMSCIVPLDLTPGTYVYTIDIPNIGINSKDPNQTPPRTFIIT